MASSAAVPFWRAAGMMYITYSNICANLVRKCLREPFKAESMNREKFCGQMHLKFETLNQDMVSKFYDVLLLVMDE
ncbi:hypothetical protein Bca4012_090144 [Brassica carinata]